MTVSKIVPVNNHLGNNSCTKFDFDFFIQSQDELQVSLTNKNGIISILQYGIDYSINEIGNENGSYITFPLASSSFGILAPDETITLGLSLVIKQESEFENSANLDLEILEKTFDYIVRVLQILDRKIERCVKTNEGVEINPDKLMEQINENALVSLNAAETSKNAANSADASKTEILEKLDYVESFSENTLNELLEKGIETRAKVDFSNLNETAEKHFVNKSQITNCITELPNQVKYTILNSELIVNASTVTIIPFGTEDLTSQYPKGTVIWNIFKVVDSQYIDGNFFIWAELQQDINVEKPTTTNISYLLGFGQTNYQIWNITQTNIFTSETQPTISGNGIWYDTINNLVKYTSDSGSTWEIVSFPIMDIAMATGGYYRIYNLFDGIGYIGSTIWADAGVKCLIPNGRNIDGSLDNIEFKNDKLRFFNVTSPENKNVVLGKNQNGENILFCYWQNRYDIASNYNRSNSGAIQNVVAIGQVSANSNFQITKLVINKPLKLLDINTPHIVEIYNFTASNGYIVWSNGWCEQWGRGKAPSTANTWGTTITLNKKYWNKAYGITLTNWGGSTQAAALKWNSDNLTESTFQVLASVQDTSFNWHTWGVLAEGEY